MKRLILFALAASAIACADAATSPRPVPQGAHRDWSCRSGYTTSDGRFVCTDSVET